MPVLTRLWAFSRPYLAAYALGFGLLVVTNGLSLSIPWLLREAIQRLEARVPLSQVAAVAGAIAAVAFGQAIVRTASRLAILGSSRRVSHDIRARFFERLLKLDAPFFDVHRTGDVMSRGVNDIRLLQGLYGPGVLNLLNTGIVYSATIVVLLRIDPLLTVVSVSVFPPMMFAVNRISRRVYGRSLAVQEQLAAISNHAQENISGIQQVKTYAQEEREIETFRDLCAEFRDRNLSMAALRGWMLSLIGIVTGVGTLVVLWVGGRFVLSGRIGFGDFVAFNAYLGLLVWPTIAMGWIINTLQRGLGAMERLGEVLDAEPTIPSPLLVGGDERGAAFASPAIEIRDLTFRYPASADGDRRPALTDVSLSIPAGGRVAIVGPVGCGKSTLAALLARVYEPPPGTLFVDGRDLTEVPVGAWRSTLGYVPQEPFLFSRTLRSNVVLAAPDAGEEELGRALTLSRLEQDLAQLPDGLDTLVGERGFTLSGGQRQRATLARAVLRRPGLLILDDALSSLDADTERAVMEGLERLMRGRTAVFITHRPSTLVHMQRIVVLDAGRIVEEGSHDELLARGGLYTRLFERTRLEQGLEGK